MHIETGYFCWRETMGSGLNWIVIVYSEKKLQKWIIAIYHHDDQLLGNKNVLQQNN